MRAEEINRITIADELRRQGIEIEMNVKEISVYLNVTSRLIYDLVAADQIPVRKIVLPSRKRPILRFSKSAIDEWRERSTDAAA